jgi:hypothetical protein
LIEGPVDFTPVASTTLAPDTFYLIAVILIRWPATYNGGVKLRARLEIHHDESGDAVRATENGNGALVVLINSAE